MKNYKINCLYCSKEFESSRRDTKYCSDSCRVLASRERTHYKTSVLVNYSVTEYKQLFDNARASGISVFDMVKYRSLVSLGDIESKEKEIATLKEEVISLKAHLSVYTKEPSSSGIFLPISESDKEYIEEIVNELKPSINSRFPDFNDTEPLEDYIIYILKNFQSL